MKNIQNLSNKLYNHFRWVYHAHRNNLDYIMYNNITINLFKSETKPRVQYPSASDAIYQWLEFASETHIAYFEKIGIGCKNAYESKYIADEKNIAEIKKQIPVLLKCVTDKIDIAAEEGKYIVEFVISEAWKKGTYIEVKNRLIALGYTVRLHSSGKLPIRAEKFHIRWDKPKS